MYGHPAEMDAIMEIAQKHGLIVIEDGAHATGASYKGKKVGSTHENNITCFSFMNKCMTVCGDGGMAVTSNEELSNSMKLHRYLGQDEVFTWQERIYLSKVIGFNYRMSEIAAAVGRIMLKKLPELNENRRRVAAVYADVLKGVSDLSLPAEKPWAYSTYLWYVVRTKDSKKNDALREFLREKGIVGTEVPYKIPIHLQPVYRRDYGYKEGDFPITEREKKECFSLSTRPPFSLEEARRNAEAVKEFFRRS